MAWLICVGDFSSFSKVTTNEFAWELGKNHQAQSLKYFYCLRNYGNKRETLGLCTWRFKPCPNSSLSLLSFGMKQACFCWFPESFIQLFTFSVDAKFCLNISLCVIPQYKPHLSLSPFISPYFQLSLYHSKGTLNSRLSPNGKTSEHNRLCISTTLSISVNLSASLITRRKKSFYIEWKAPKVLCKTLSWWTAHAEGPGG